MGDASTQATPSGAHRKSPMSRGCCDSRLADAAGTQDSDQAMLGEQRVQRDQVIVAAEESGWKWRDFAKWNLDVSVSTTTAAGSEEPNAKR